MLLLPPPPPTPKAAATIDQTDNVQSVLVLNHKP
jgi:hypothetical protein